MSIVTVSCFYYKDKISLTNSLSPFTFSILEGWTPSTTYSGFSYSFGQKSNSIDSIYKYTGLSLDNNNQFTFSTLDLTSSTIYSFEAETINPIYFSTIQDSYLILLYVVGSYSLNNFQIRVADVNLSNSINSTDALLVVRRSVGLIEEFSAGSWLLESRTFSLSDLSGNSTIGYSFSLNLSNYGDIDDPLLSITPTETPTPTVTPTITITSTPTMTPTPSNIPEIFTFSGKLSPEDINSSAACSSYDTEKFYYSTKSLQFIISGDIIYDDHLLSSPTIGAEKWISLTDENLLKRPLQINNFGVVISTFYCF